MTFAKHILFPVDFSERSKLARPHVLALAGHFQAKVTLFHVIPIPIGWYGGMEQAFPVMFDVDEMVANGRQELEEFFESPPPELKVETAVSHGDPAAHIIEYAERHDVDLIMMPTHGYGKFRSLLLGSVTAKVLHDAKCAVWTAAHTEDPDLARHTGYQSILCATGLEPENASLIRYAGELARSFKARFHLVHAVSTVLRSDDYLDVGFEQSLIDASREGIARLQREAGTKAGVCLKVGSVSSVLRASALEHRADLIVIGRGRLQATLGRLRTNAYAIIRDSPCPVLSV